MVLKIFQRDQGSTQSAPKLSIEADFSDAGITYRSKPATENWIERLDLFTSDAFTVALLSQLEEMGYLERTGDSVDLSWSNLYQFLAQDEGAQTELLATLKLPPLEKIRPSLSSQGSLEDNDFRVTLGAWIDEQGQAMRQAPIIVGGVAKFPGKTVLLSEPVWSLVHEVASLYRTPGELRSGRSNRAVWSKMRKFALDAKCPMADFLLQTVVLTPEKLDLKLRQSEGSGAFTLQVEPMFGGAPEGWLSIFDRMAVVPERYDLPTANGIVQVLLDPAVRSVLQEIRRWPNRYVSGQRAEAFVRNPFAALGEDASKVIDEKAFEAERERVGIVFKRFSFSVSRDVQRAIQFVSLEIETTSRYSLAEESIPFSDSAELGRFIEKLRGRLSAGFESVQWKGHDLELLGDAVDQLSLVEHVWDEWKEQEASADAGASDALLVISYADVYDLSNYSQRVEGIGVEKPYVSPFIAKKDEDSPWIPENTVFGVLVRPAGGGEPVPVVLGDDEKEKLKIAVAQAKSTGATTVAIPGVPGGVSIADAEEVLQALAKIPEIISGGGPSGGKGPGETPPEKPKPWQASSTRKSLLLKGNIDDVDYLEERRITLELPSNARATLPRALRTEIALKDHQLVGVAWLQHLYSRPRNICSGALLADDMGLGKTIQLLTFIQSCLEQDPCMDPVLIVAPVTLLENWKEEIDKFFVPGSLPVLMLYGDYLKEKKLSKAEIDPLLINEGIVRFLRPGWLDGAKVVLTTFETLRDLEFSLAAQHWSIMVCDEAQKIKNPNALVSRAAKKQNVQFKIACTGTPVENSLVDLWCLFDFIQPGLLGALNHFGMQYRRPIEAKTDEEKSRVEELRKLIEPQTLRRTKKQVAKDLPQKIEVQDCRNILLSPYQRQLYSHAINVFKNGDGSGSFSNHLGMIQYLRQLCTDPRPIGHTTSLQDTLDEYQLKAPKLKWLIETLNKIQAKQEKAIVFVEFQDLQRILQRFIKESFGLTPDIINGTTTASATAANSRQKRIRAFQERPGFGVIILSPLAVGYGVNIQAANHVIHYTRTWNPAKEDQATDRAYRIGATKDVFVYYPVVTAEFVTFDMKLDRLLGWKRNLSDDMLNGCGDLSAADFSDLSSPGGESVFSNDVIQPDEIQSMSPKMFECLIAILHSKQEYPIVYRTPDSNDAGVDVVAIRDAEGLLIQCKTSMTTKALGWDAVKEVVGGTAFYSKKHPGVQFKRIAATNVTFNSTAYAQAQANQVELLTATELMCLLASMKIHRFEVESMLVG